jgi:hypothetical protein
MRFSGAAATYFDDTGLSSDTGQLSWSAPILLPALPAAGTFQRFLLARSGTVALAGLDITASGRLRVTDGGGVLRGTSTTALAVNRWYTVETLIGQGQATVRIFGADGALLTTVGPVPVTSGTPTAWRTGLRTVARPLLIDHTRVSDDWITALPAAPPPPPPPPPFTPCGSLPFDPAQPPVYSHVVVLMEENWSFHDFATSAQSPFLTGLAANCGTETDFHVATHPSQPNYMAATSGIPSKLGITTGADNVFSQVAAAGLTWKSYEESMPAPCSGSTNTTYKPGHNPAFYYSALRTPTNTCAVNDVPLQPALSDDLAAGQLPAYTWITPNRCHIFEWSTGCPGREAGRIAAGDQWLSTVLPQLTATADYQAGNVLILVTFDEGVEDTNTNDVDCTDPAYSPTHPDCQVPAVVVSPYLTPGTTDGTDLNLYALLGTTEDVLGLPRLGRAVGQPSMRATMPF